MNAKGSLKAAKDLKVDPLRLDLTRETVIKKTSKETEKLISSGHGKMPKQEKLTSDQIRSVLKYLQNLQSLYARR